MRVKIEHRLGIRAPAEQIWALIADIRGWPAWNPLYPRAQGEVRIGSRLDLDVAIPGQDRRSIRPTIVDWVPNEQLIWRLSLLGGLFRSTRYFEIEQLTDSGCIFSNGEMFEGLVGPFVARRMRPAIRSGFAALGEAVKSRIEGSWRPDPAAPT